MAEPVLRGDKYRHIIMVAGVRRSGTFKIKKDARAWEAELRSIAETNPNSVLIRKRYKLTEAVDRYVESVTPTKRGALKWEVSRFNDMISKFPDAYLEDITSDRVSKWRDEMLKRVSGSTVNRYFNLYSNLFTVAKKEWQWADKNPFSDVKRPLENPSREAVWGWREIRRVLREGQRRGGGTGEVVRAFHIALHTSLRLQEALAAPSGYDKSRGVIMLGSSKTSRTKELIPTVSRARRMLSSQKPINVNPNLASTIFSNLCKEMMIKGLQFKDSRATCLTLLSRRVDVLTLAKISRHKNLELLHNCYYRETAEAISRRL
jgi:integrase